MEEIIQKIRTLAERYETPGFLKNDPSKFMHCFTGVKNQEACAFISANLAFGNRKQILSHVEMILKEASPSPAEWIEKKGYRAFFRADDEESQKKSFYRMYTNADMILFFDTLNKIFCENETAGSYFKTLWEQKKNKDTPYLHHLICSTFNKNCALVPHTKESAAKKINMMLRWLVRQNSPVDLGLWAWFNQKDLLMPLDVHVMRQAQELKLIHSKSASLKTALELTDKMKKVFPDDPVRADYALFGFDMETSKN